MNRRSFLKMAVFSIAAAGIALLPEAVEAQYRKRRDDRPGKRRRKRRRSRPGDVLTPPPERCYRTRNAHGRTIIFCS